MNQENSQKGKAPTPQGYPTFPQISEIFTTLKWAETGGWGRVLKIRHVCPEYPPGWYLLGAKLIWGQNNTFSVVNIKNCRKWLELRQETYIFAKNVDNCRANVTFG